MKIQTIIAKSVLTPSGLPSDDFVINPYGGCAFGCAYCYADFTRRFQGHLQDVWGEYVDVKINAPEILDKEMSLLMKKIQNNPNLVWKNGNKYPVIFISSVVDPYQGMESTYQITRQCLEVIAKHNFPGEVSILTKSPLVIKDIDILKQLKNVSVGFTITSTDDSVSRLIEKNAPAASFRLQALQKINNAELNSYVCINPLLPHYADKNSELRKLFQSIKDAGTDKVFIEHLNLSGQKKRRLFNELKEKMPTEILEEFWFSQTDGYKRKLERIVWSIVNELGFTVLGGGIIDHEKIMNRKKSCTNSSKFVLRGQRGKEPIV
jgi:DNA repair photolyase